MVPEDAKAEGARLVRDLLGIDRPSAEALSTVVADVLGRTRAERCAQLVRAGRLSRRRYEFANLAALVVGTKDLGDDWWATSRHRADDFGDPEMRPTPDTVLRSGPGPGEWQHGTVLDVLARWTESDAADALWGPSVGYVDLNSLHPSDRIALPEGARPGDRLVADFEDGGRVDVDVVRRTDGTLGSELAIDSCRHSPPAEAWWGWASVTGRGQHRLPGEIPGAPTDPYAAPMEPTAAETLREWALRHGADETTVGPSWTNAGDVIAALDAADLTRRRDGRWLYWERAASALADGDTARLEKELAALIASG
jgi:hypothetical protein